MLGYAYIACQVLGFTKKFVLIYILPIVCHYPHRLYSFIFDQSNDISGGT